MENNGELRYKRAKERVAALKSFYSNLAAYCIVIPILAYLNFRTTSFPWVVFPALGWGIGLIGHWFCTIGYNPILGKNWEEQKIREYMESDRI
ncbi:2TM domain-containing protein [Flagellimonas eckloniae]|uniref:Histidine kinase n=1 Tax=Flagellimonas eckloniae TaxID=346185 RepID=A0A0Q0XC95_9FLAO|nr:2TM domain-containing protein [Allomuricauda eckloniae]KQC28724.1 histidine kinase [Allomuricauda eckloniae]